MGVGPMNLVITNDALYQLSYTSEPFMTLTAPTGYIILSDADICKDFFLTSFTFFAYARGRGFLETLFSLEYNALI